MVVRLLAARLAGMIVTLLISSFVVYSAVYLAPGSPIATLTGGRPLPAETLQEIEKSYNLDKPFLERYAIWLGDAVRGDFGQSIAFRQDVGPLIVDRAQNSALLVAYAGLLTLGLGISLGAVAAMRGGRLETGIVVLGAVGLAIPSFVAALLLIYLFGVELAWFPIFGAGEGIADKLYHLTLPAIALAIATVAYVSRITRSAIATEKNREHVETARSRGLTERVIVRRHVLRNAAIPITTVATVTVASLIAGAVVVEFAFSIDGLGSYLVSSVTNKDFAAVQAICLILVAVFVVLSTAVDLLYAQLDPRIGLARGRR
ncbi:MAG: peptide/nickel transport system permease protein [Thermoleophilaceae bacterium]|jgi:peptide/nickel transport system permease protein|nr:peptide/nickel transport system permease protein [Thermoleophilaceae bacterium]